MLSTPRNQLLVSTTLSQVKLSTIIAKAVPRLIIIRNEQPRIIARIAIIQERGAQGDRDLALHLLNLSFQKSKAILRVVALSAMLLKEKKKSRCNNQILRSASYLSTFKSLK